MSTESESMMILIKTLTREYDGILKEDLIHLIQYHYKKEILKVWKPY